MIDILSYKLGQKAGGGSGGGGGGGSTEEWIGDGNTHIWISLPEGRTSPVLGVGVNGTVTVDWGDGTEPDVLTGTSTNTLVYTPNHAYAKAGDYVITLLGDGKLSIFKYNYANLLAANSSPSLGESYFYRNAIRKVECGDNVTTIGDGGFGLCYTLADVAISKSVTTIGNAVFQTCTSLNKVVIPNSVKSIGVTAFGYCSSLTEVVIPNGVTSITNSMFTQCGSLNKLAVPESVTSIGSAVFSECYNFRCMDFSKHTAVPTLSNKNAFSSVAIDFEIRVPMALVDEWKAATNWSTYAEKIVGV